MPAQYTVSDALLGLGDEDMKRKGSQIGSVREKNGRWYITFSEWRRKPDGSVFYGTTERLVEGARSERAARKLGFEQHVSKANSVAAIPQGRATLKEFVDVCFRPQHISRKKKNGRSFYESLLTKHILPSLGECQLNEVNPRIVQMFLDSKQREYSTQTVKHLRNAISAVYRRAKFLKYFEGELPTEGVTISTVVHKQRGAMSAAQEQIALDAIPQRYRPITAFFSYTGARPGEVAGLRWKRVNLTGEWIVKDGLPIAPYSVLLIDNWTRGELVTLKTTGSVRQTPLSSGAWVLLTLMHEAAGNPSDEAFVFAGRTGRPLNTSNILKRHLKSAGKAAGFPAITFYSFRHTKSTAADLVGMSAAEKAALLGHVSQQMGMRYTHPELERVRAALELTENTGKTLEKEYENAAKTIQ